MNTQSPRVLALDDGFDDIAGKPFLDCFHWCNGNGAEPWMESYAQYPERCGIGVADADSSRKTGRDKMTKEDLTRFPLFPSPSFLLQAVTEHEDNLRS